MQAPLALLAKQRMGLLPLRALIQTRWRALAGYVEEIFTIKWNKPGWGIAVAVLEKFKTQKHAWN